MKKVELVEAVAEMAGLTKIPAIIKNLDDKESSKVALIENLQRKDLSPIEEEVFIKGVCLLAASDLWNKYNIRVNNEDLEDTYMQSYGGLLYKQSINILNSFINQRVTTSTILKRKRNNCKF